MMKEEAWMVFECLTCQKGTDQFLVIAESLGRQRRDGGRGVPARVRRGIGEQGAGPPLCDRRERRVGEVCGRYIGHAKPMLLGTRRNCSNSTLPARNRRLPVELSDMHLLSLGQAATLSGRSIGEIRRAAKRGELSARNLNGVWITTEEAVETYEIDHPPKATRARERFRVRGQITPLTFP